MTESRPPRGALQGSDKKSLPSKHHYTPCRLNNRPSPYTMQLLMIGPGEKKLKSVEHLLTSHRVILKEKVKELNLYEMCAVCLEEFKPKDELGICPCKHAFHRKCLIKWLEVRKVCPLCNMPVLQLAQLHSNQEHRPPQGPLPGAENIV
ncbi:RING finger 24 isoform X1 [Pelobates cultripes]|uniref:RING finger 24 isoform X1 n=1 Tax=Pelobates cultripes TaxID=61616 RepID=A0AAD1SIJ3_PELCU|nr:RING finger 24 isoform X1 [Pelobates cultripes]